MLEVHATPLMTATLVLLFLICVWWLVVEWSFKPDSSLQTSKNRKATSTDKDNGGYQKTTDTDNYSVSGTDKAVCKNVGDIPPHNRRSKSSNRRSKQHTQQNNSLAAIKTGFANAQNTTANSKAETNGLKNTGASDSAEVLTAGKNVPAHHVKKSSSDIAKAFSTTVNQHTGNKSAHKPNSTDTKIQEPLSTDSGGAKNAQRKHTPSAPPENRSDSPNNQQGSIGPSPQPALPGGSDTASVARQVGDTSGSQIPDRATVTDTDSKAQQALPKAAQGTQAVQSAGKDVPARHVKKSNSDIAKAFSSTVNQRTGNKSAHKPNSTDTKIQEPLSTDSGGAKNAQRKHTPSAPPENRSDSPNNQQGSIGPSPQPALPGGSDTASVAGQVGDTSGGRIPDRATVTDTDNKAQQALPSKAAQAAQSVSADKAEPKARLQNSTDQSVANTNTDRKQQNVNRPSGKQHSRHSEDSNSSSDTDNTANPARQLETNKTASLNNIKKTPERSKYQTAAKAKSPSVRNEASIQIPTPTHHQSKDQTSGSFHSNNKHGKSTEHQSTDATRQASGNSASVDHTGQRAFNANSKTASDKHSAQNAIEPNRSLTNVRSIGNAATGTQQSSNKAESKGSTNKPTSLAGLKNNSGARKQSSIEMAIAHRVSAREDQLNPTIKPSGTPAAEKSSAEITMPNTAKSGTQGFSLAGNRTTGTSTSSSSADAETSASGHAQQNNVAALADEEVSVSRPDAMIDADATLRAQLVLSERRIESLQSTLNNLQQLPAVAATVAATASSPAQHQHNRPTLLSKVRILDHPKA